VSQPPNSRVISVQVQCATCRIPAYSELQKNVTYNVLINDFLAKGGDGFHMLEGLETTSLGTFIHHNFHFSRCLRAFIVYRHPSNIFSIVSSILIGVTTADALEQYFQKHSPVYSGVEWRIVYKDNAKTTSNLETNNPSNLGTTHQSIGMTILLLIITWLSLI